MGTLRWKERVKALEREVYALYLAFRDPRIPWYVKAAMAAVVGYALSPVDLIPDFIPIIGLLDDLILVPLGIALVIRMTPREVLEDCRRRAEAELASKKPKIVAAAAFIALLWLAIAFVVVRKVVKSWRVR
jgi:uncharacterized membrane protein YkvA (DUF1232 family)